MNGLETEITIELAPERAVAGGRVLARHEGKVILVAGALPGERVRARITRDEKRWAEAETVEVLEAHPRRREPPCPHAARCGGCDWQHAERDVQLEMKRQIVVDAFRRIGGLDAEKQLEGPDFLGEEFGARQRVTLTFDPTGRPGLLERGTHEVVPIDGCAVVRPELDEKILPWLRLAPPWRRVHVRFGTDGSAVVLFETGDPPSDRDRRRFTRLTKSMERDPSLIGMLADRIPIGGKRELRFRVHGADLRADATSFFQGSGPGAEALVDVVGGMLGDDRAGQLLDLYAGVGLFAVCLGRGFERVAAVEADARAARYLRRNLRKAGVRAEVIAGRADIALDRIERAPTETVIIDPPRTGLDRETRRALVARAPARIISVSCDPATAARDTAVLVRAGWQLVRLAALDLFPVTAHIETVALLHREDAAPAG